MELNNGKLLQSTRWHCREETSPWEHVHKTVCFLNSDDGGYTWNNAHPALSAAGQPVLVHGQRHGQCTQLPDGRVILVHDHRYPYSEGQTIARLSNDEGQTWDERAFHLSLGHGYPAVIATEDGTIISVSGVACWTTRRAP